MSWPADELRQGVAESTKIGNPVYIDGCEWDDVVNWLVKNVGPLTKKNPNYAQGWEGRGWILYPTNRTDEEGLEVLELSADTKLANKQVLKQAIQMACSGQQGVAEGEPDYSVPGNWSAHSNFPPTKVLGSVYNTKGVYLGKWDGKRLIPDPNRDSVWHKWRDEQGDDWARNTIATAPQMIQQGRWTVKPEQGVAEGGLGIDHKRNRFKSLNMRENAEELNIGDPVIISGKGIEFEGKTGDIDSFGNMKRFVVVNLYNHGRHSFHSSDVSYNDYADKEDDLDEDMYQYDAQDPYNSEFAPRAGMGRMTLRGWKQQMIKRTAELAQQMSAAGQDIDKSALWDNVHAKLKSMNMDPIAQEIEQAQAELEKIRQRGGIRSRAFK
jgi:hypothetical protein